MSTFVTSIFQDRTFAEMAVAKLESLGYQRDEISVLTDSQTRAQSFSQDTGTTAIDGRERGSGAAVAATFGGALGAILASAAVLGTVRFRSTEPGGIVETSADARPAADGEPAPAVDTVAGDGTLGAAVQASPDLGGSGPVVAGPLRALVAAAGAGGIIGALAGAGLTPDLAKRHGRELAAGGILIGVHPHRGDDVRVRDALREIAVGTKPPTP